MLVLLLQRYEAALSRGMASLWRGWLYMPISSVHISGKTDSGIVTTELSGTDLPTCRSEGFSTILPVVAASGWPHHKLSRYVDPSVAIGRN